MTGKLATWANGLGAARHMLALAVLAGSVIVTATLLFARVAANEEKITDSKEQIEALKATLQHLGTQQEVIKEKIDNAEKSDQTFRGSVTRALERIENRITPSKDNR